MTALTPKVLASYSTTAVPLAAMTLPIAVYLPPFYAETMGISIAAVGLIFSAARIWDVITDPIMGAVIDRYETRWGRRKHWIAAGVPILLLAVWMIFLPDTESVSQWSLGGWLFLLYIGYTMMTIAHQSWGAELAPDYDSRSRLFSWREIFLVAGMTIALAIPAFIEMAGEGDPQTKVAGMGIYVLILLPLCVLPTLLFVPDQRTPTKVAVNWGQALRILVANSTMWRLLVTVFGTNFASTASGSLYIFFSVYIFELRDHASMALLFYFLAGTLAMPFWMKLALKIGKHDALKIALIYGIIVKLGIWLFAEPGDVFIFWTYTLIAGVAFGAAPTLLRSMMADLTDDDELASGDRKSGLFFSILNTVDKLGSALAVGFTLALVGTWAGFAPGADNSESALNGLLLVYVFVPVVAWALSWIPLIRYPLDKRRHEEILHALDELNAKRT